MVTKMVANIYFAPLDITTRNAASSLAAASLCIVSVTCEYRSIVVGFMQKFFGRRKRAEDPLRDIQRLM